MRTARLVSIMVMLLGVSVMLGWHQELPRLIQLHPAWVPMQYNTAVGFLLSGVALWALASQGRGLARSAAALVALLGGLTLGQDLLGLTLGIDQLLMQHHIQVGVTSPGRMAPNTALSFLLCASCVILMSRTNGHSWELKLAGILAGMMAGLGAVALIGYALDIPNAYGWTGQVTRMAAHTALGFLLLGIGAMALAWQWERVRHEWFSVVTAILMSTITLMLWQALHANHPSGTQDPAGSLLLAFGLAMALATAWAVRQSIKMQQLAAALLEHKHALEQRIEARTAELRVAREQALRLAQAGCSHPLPRPMPPPPGASVARGWGWRFRAGWSSGWGGRSGWKAPWEPAAPFGSSWHSSAWRARHCKNARVWK
jgi:hypothetical protein